MQEGILVNFLITVTNKQTNTCENNLAKEGLFSLQLEGIQSRAQPQTMTWQLSAPVALPEDQALFPNTHISSL